MKDKAKERKEKVVKGEMDEKRGEERRREDDVKIKERRKKKKPLK